MKIAILTFHYAYNYGAVLQAYGLQEVLKQLGHQVDIADYRNKAIVNRIHPFSWKAFLRNPLSYVICFLNVYIGYARRVKHFRLFASQRLSLSSRLSQEALKNADYDVVVIGSDQVWNPRITGGPDAAYWGQQCNPATKVISYAASSGDTAMLQTPEFAEINAWLTRFAAIGVRETRLKDFLAPRTALNVEVVLDPTLLAGREVFEKITPQRIVPEPYVLVYRVEENSRLMRIAREVARLYHARLVVAAPLSIKNALKLRKGEAYANVAVEDLLSLIKYAECVVALSFHGTALAAVYEKNFFSVVGGNMARVETLLKPLNLLGRIVADETQVSNENIDYSAVTPRLEQMRRGSRTFLETAILS